MDVNQLKKLILTMNPNDFVEEHIIPKSYAHFSHDQLDYVRNKISEATGISISEDEIYVVGSANIGYGLFNKRTKSGQNYKAFREFSKFSDVDIAFASSTLFDKVWGEINSYANLQQFMPHRMNKLGDYLVYGWLRPDQFPKDVRFNYFDKWNDAVKELSREKILGRRKISGALYRDVEFIKKYQARSIAKCKKDLELI
jgi:hypothetical protein